VYVTLAFFYFYTQPNRTILFQPFLFYWEFYLLLSSKNITIVQFTFIFERFYSKEKTKAKKKSWFNHSNCDLQVLFYFQSKIKELFSLEFKSDAIVNTTNTAKDVNKVSIYEVFDTR
jgi:hypothetical protein